MQMAEIWLDPKTVEIHDVGKRLARTDAGEPKGCLHTTETSGLPSYKGWTVEPHGDVMPFPNKGVRVREFLPLNYSSFSLRHTRAQDTNRDNVVQWELVGTCLSDGPGYYWPDADDAVLLSLYDKVIAPCSAKMKIPLAALPFKKPDTARRLTDSQFDLYSGWLGHEHVPQNTHVDPGAFPWDRMIHLARERTRQNLMRIMEEVEVKNNGGLVMIRVSDDAGKGLFYAMGWIDATPKARIIQWSWNDVSKSLSDFNNDPLDLVEDVFYQLFDIVPNAVRPSA